MPTEHDKSAKESTADMMVHDRLYDLQQALRNEKLPEHVCPPPHYPLHRDVLVVLTQGVDAILRNLKTQDATLAKAEQKLGNVAIQIATLTEQLANYQKGTGAVALHEVELEGMVTRLVQKLTNKTTGNVPWICGFGISVCCAFVAHLVFK